MLSHGALGKTGCDRLFPGHEPGHKSQMRLTMLPENKDGLLADTRSKAERTPPKEMPTYRSTDRTAFFRTSKAREQSARRQQRRENAAKTTPARGFPDSWEPGLRRK